MGFVRGSLSPHFIQFSYQLPFVHLAFLGLSPDHDLALSEATDLVGLVLLDLLPELSVLLDADLLGGIELVEATEVHVLGEQGNDVLVESLPVRVLKVVPMA